MRGNSPRAPELFYPINTIGCDSKKTTLKLIHSETRNVSEKLIGAIKNSVRRKSSFEKNPTIKGRAENLQDLRIRIEKSTWLLLLKRGANLVLDALSLGSTIVMILRRPE